MTAKSPQFNGPIYPDEYRPGDSFWSVPLGRPPAETSARTSEDPADTKRNCVDLDGARINAAAPVLDLPGVGLDPDCLSTEERELIAEMRALPTVPHLAIRCFLVRGDLRLAQALYDQLCLGLGPQLVSQAGDDIG